MESKQLWENGHPDSFCFHHTEKVSSSLERSVYVSNFVLTAMEKYSAPQIIVIANEPRDLLKSFKTTRTIAYSVIDGTQSPEQKILRSKQFAKGDIHVLIFKAGIGLSFDDPIAKTIVFYDIPEATYLTPRIALSVQYAVMQKIRMDIYYLIKETEIVENQLSSLLALYLLYNQTIPHWVKALKRELSVNGSVKNPDLDIEVQRAKMKPMVKRTTSIKTKSICSEKLSSPINRSMNAHPTEESPEHEKAKISREEIQRIREPSPLRKLDEGPVEVFREDVESVKKSSPQLLLSSTPLSTTREDSFECVLAMSEDVDLPDDSEFSDEEIIEEKENSPETPSKNDETVCSGKLEESENEEEKMKTEKRRSILEQIRLLQEQIDKDDKKAITSTANVSKTSSVESVVVRTYKTPFYKITKEGEEPDKEGFYLDGVPSDEDYDENNEVNPGYDSFDDMIMEQEYGDDY